MQNNLGQRVWTSVLEPRILAKQLKTCEVAVGALSNEYGRAPVVVTEEMVAAMRPNSIIIDVAIDRGGCFETSELTSYEEPTFLKHGVIHYCVPNIPSGFARTASQAVSNVLMPLLLEIGDDQPRAQALGFAAHLMGRFAAVAPGTLLWCRRQLHGGSPGNGLYIERRCPGSNRRQPTLTITDIQPWLCHAHSRRPKTTRPGH